MGFLLLFLVSIGLWGAVAWAASVDPSLMCAFAPLAAGMTYVAVKVLAGGHERTQSGYRSSALPDHFRILKTGDGFVDFEHPEGGSWGHGMAEDIRSVNNVELVESLGGHRYRLHVNRNSRNAARVLEAAYRFRTEPKATRDGIVDLNSCPGYDILYQEAIYDLD